MKNNFSIALRLICLIFLGFSSHAASPIDDGDNTEVTEISSYEDLACAGGEEPCDSTTVPGSSLESTDNPASPPIASAQDATSLEQALDALMLHLDGSDDLTTAELYDLRDTIVEHAEALVGNAGLIQNAYNAIQSYESTNGALFTSDGTQSFSRGDSDTDGRELERTIHAVYLAAFDAIDSNLISSNPALVEGLVFGSADYFPGPVAAPANPNAVYETLINASVPEDWGRPNLYSTGAARRPTGAYLAPGTIAEVIVPAALVNNGYQIRVGAHSWDLSGRPTQLRIARASKLYPITSTTTQVANPLGGSIYIDVPYLADEGMVSIELKNTIRAPYFSARSFDQITAAQWNNTERNQPGPWTDIETDKVMLSVPSKWIRDFDFAGITEILEDYDTNIDFISDYMGKPRVRNKTLLFMQVDVSLRGNAFFPGYPMGNYPHFNSATPRAPLQLNHSFDQTLLHEHGHGTYMTKFSRETEAAVHMLYPYIATQRFGMPLEEAFSASLHYSRVTNRTMDEIFISWALRDEFIDDIDMGHENAAYKHRGHADYIEYVGLFGWDALTEFNRKLNVDFVETGFDFDRNNHNNNDRILRFSREAGVDVRPLFHLWGHSPSDDNALQESIDAENLAPSAAIYDVMVGYKSTIPFTQADYDAWYAKISPVLFTGHRFDFWDPLAASYDTDRAQDAVDRIDALLAQYFPNGRPQDPAVTFYEGENFTGASWSVGPGSFNIDALAASAIGNDNLSSIRIEPGYAVTICQHGNNGGLCETYTSSVAQLGALNNQASSISVAQVTLTTMVDQFPGDLQLYPRDTVTNTAAVTVSGTLGQDSTAAELNVYRDGVLWNTSTHNRSDSAIYQFDLELPAELANYDFELLVTGANNNQTVLASAESVVAGDVFVINGQSNAVSGIFSITDAAAGDANEFIRSYGGWGPTTWNDNDDWHVVRADCRPLSEPLACVGRMGLRFAAGLLENTQIPVAIINQASGGQSIDYFRANTNDVNDLTTNYGQLLTRLENGGLADNIRGLLWYQGEDDRTDNQAHFNQFPALFDQWQIQYPSVDQYYVFQIRHTCVPADADFGQGSQISNFQREFANARDNVTPVSTTGLDGHDGCHFRYENGYQQMGDNIARIVRSELYGENLDNAVAADIVTASQLDETTLGLTFTDGNTLVADDGFEALFELRDSNDNAYNITAGVVQNGTVVELTVDRPIEEGGELFLSYLSLPGDQNWLTNSAGIGILTFLDFPVASSQSTGETVNPTQPIDPPDPILVPIPVDPTEPSDPQPITSYDVDTDRDGVPDSVEVAENTDPSSATSFRDTDNDGVADFTDADSDGDGVWNLFESGAFPYYDRDGDAVPAYLDDNDYNEQVSNNDNRVESLFDANNNGIADFTEAETSILDTDGDGVPDSVEAADTTGITDDGSFLDFDNDNIPDYLDEDDDNDGILDVMEGSSDADADGLANLFDTDSDGDGISDSVEGIADIDGDSLPNFLDATTTSVIAEPDQDNDGIADAVEGTEDSDQDGIANLLDTDSDSDSLSDREETNADVDGDGVPNFLDHDSDADGISDAIEGLGDTDNDTLGNAVDYDSDSDAIPDSIELADDPDADGIPNFLDTDSDGDGVSDLVETAGDSDNNGVADFLDNDGSDQSTPNLVTGTGCTSGSGGGPVDPLLFILLMVSITVLWRRQRTGYPRFRNRGDNIIG